jgi:malonate transporter
MFDAILPVFLVILLGAAMRRWQWMPEAFFPCIESFSYNVAFPALLFAGTARLNFHSGEVGQLALATLLPTALILALALLALLMTRTLPAAARSSVVQGAVRPNTYFGIAVSALLFDTETAALVMLALALCLPAVNVVSVVALCWWSGKQVDVRQIGRTLARNPIILATLAGVLFSLTGLGLPPMVGNTLDILGRAALCLGLLCVGGGLVFSMAGLRPVTLSLTSLLKLVMLPLAAALVCNLAGVAPAVTLAACFYCALPTAPNAYIMAKQLGGDARLMASLITVQTLLALVTVPLGRSLLPGG